MLGVAQRRSLGIDCVRLFADIRRLQDTQAFGVGSHDSILNTVVHHFNEVAGSIGTAMQIPLLGGAIELFASWSARDIAAPRSKCREYRVKATHNIVFAADHHAV